MEKLDTKTDNEFLHVLSGIQDGDILNQMETTLAVKSGIRISVVFRGTLNPLSHIIPKNHNKMSCMNKLSNFTLDCVSEEVLLICRGLS